MPGRGSCGCKIVVGTVMGGEYEYSFTRGGWGDAQERALRIAKAPGHTMALVDVVCAGGRFPVYQCSTDRGDTFCSVERFSARDGEVPIDARKKAPVDPDDDATVRRFKLLELDGGRRRRRPR